MKKLPFNFKFIISMFLLALGIQLVVMSSMGATAVTSASYVLSLVAPISFAVVNTLFNVSYIFLQKLILKDSFKPIQYFQIFIAFLLGFAMDLWEELLRFIEVQSPLEKWFFLFLGCFFIAYSTSLQIRNTKIYNPAEGFVYALAKKYKKPFGNIKLGFDLSLVFLGILISYISFGEIRGVGIATIIAGLIIGPLIRLIEGLFKKLYPEIPNP